MSIEVGHYSFRAHKTDAACLHPIKNDRVTDVCGSLPKVDCIFKVHSEQVTHRANRFNRPSRIVKIDESTACPAEVAEVSYCGKAHSLPQLIISCSIPLLDVSKPQTLVKVLTSSRGEVSTIDLCVTPRGL